ncbi:MAG: hypothetical protein EOP51_30580, partial [Sphingobacteriales bacterium]
PNDLELVCACLIVHEFPVVFNNVTDATFAFKYRRVALDVGDEVAVVINGTTLYTITRGPVDDTQYSTVTIAIPAATLIANGTNTFAFVNNGGMSDTDFVYVDNVRVTFATSSNQCFVVKQDVSTTNGRFTNSNLNTYAITVSGLGNCYKNKFLGVIAHLTASNDSYNIVTDVPQTLAVLSNDVIGKPNPASVTVTTAPANGVVTVNPNGTITYTPNSGYNGADSFVYNVCSADDPTVCSSATVTLSVACTSVPGQNNIVGLVYNDANGNGVRNTGDAGVQNVSVDLYNDTNADGAITGVDTLNQTVVTAASGAYQFSITPTTATSTVRDQFGAVAYNNNNGTANWATNWVETGEATSPTTGNITVAGGVLRISGASVRSIQRSVNLSAAFAATLTYDCTKTGGTAATDILNVQGSPDGAAWTTLGTIGPANSTTAGSFDMTPYISTTTFVRFQIANAANTGVYSLDNIQ